MREMRSEFVVWNANLLLFNLLKSLEAVQPLPMKKSLFLSVLSIACALPLGAQTTLLTAVADGAVQSSGVLGLSLVNDENNSTTRSGASNIRQSIYEFDLSALSIEANVVAAYFDFDTRLLANIGTTAVFRIDGYVGDGIVGTDDFDFLEALGGDLLGEYSLVTADSTFRPLSLQLTNLAPLQAAITAGEDYYGLRTETNNFATIQVSSLENTYGDAVPTLRLVLEPVPEPSTIGLLALGLLGLARRSRK